MLKDGWWSEVTRAALETNWTTIWSRNQQASSLAGQQAARGREAELDVVMETRGKAHVDQILLTLEAAGFPAKLL